MPQSECPFLPLSVCSVGSHPLSYRRRIGRGMWLFDRPLPGQALRVRRLAVPANRCDDTQGPVHQPASKNGRAGIVPRP
jgi:hypothetical protein